MTNIENSRFSPSFSRPILKFVNRQNPIYTIHVNRVCKQRNIRPDTRCASEIEHSHACGYAQVVFLHLIFVARIHYSCLFVDEVLAAELHGIGSIYNVCVSTFSPYAEASCYRDILTTFKVDPVLSNGVGFVQKSHGKVSKRSILLASTPALKAT